MYYTGLSLYQKQANFPKMRINLLIKLLILLLLTSCSLTTTSHKKNPINHIVLIWFNDSINTQSINSIATKAEKNLKQIKKIKSLQIGNAIKSQRKIVDDSFDLGLIFQFKNEKDMNDYINHPIHKSFVQKYLKNQTKKIIVYDF